MTDIADNKLTAPALTGPVGEIIASLGSAVVGVESCSDRRGIARIDPERLVEVSQRLFDTPGARFATATAIDARDGIDVLYHWVVDPHGAIITLKALAERPEMTLDSIGRFIPAANWIEREMHDLMGANFRDHPDMRRLLLDDSWPEGLYPLRKDFDQIADRPPLPPTPPAPEEQINE